MFNTLASFHLFIFQAAYTTYSILYYKLINEWKNFLKPLESTIYNNFNPNKKKIEP